MSKIDPIWEKESEPLRRAFNIARREGAITQQKLADQLDVSQGIMGRWINGKKRIPDDKLLMLSTILSFDPLEARPDLIHLLDLVNTAISGGQRDHLTKKIQQLDANEKAKIDSFVDFVLSQRDK